MEFRPEPRGADEPRLLKPVPVGADDVPGDNEPDERDQDVSEPTEEDRRWWAEQARRTKGGDE